MPAFALAVLALPTLMSPAVPASPLELIVAPPRGLQVGESTEITMRYVNRSGAPLRLWFGNDCGVPEVETPLLDGQSAALPTVTMCAEAPAEVVETVNPGRSLRSTVSMTPGAAGEHALQVRYHAEGGPAGSFQGEVVSAPLTVRVAPPDPPGPVVELQVPKRLVAGRPFRAIVRHHNRGGRGWILFNEACSGPPRDFVVVDGEERPVPGRGPCRPEWKDRMTLEPGRHFDTPVTLTLSPGRHRLKALYRLGAEYERAVVWKGTAESPEVEVEVVAPR